jgi:hypothetical protein
MAKLAEKAKITSIFFADTYAGHDVYGGNMDAVFRAGTQVAQLDPPRHHFGYGCERNITMLLRLELTRKNRQPQNQSPLA